MEVEASSGPALKAAKWAMTPGICLSGFQVLCKMGFPLLHRVAMMISSYGALYSASGECSTNGLYYCTIVETWIIERQVNAHRNEECFQLSSSIFSSS